MKKIVSVIIASVFLLSIVSAGSSHGLDLEKHKKERSEKLISKVTDRVSDERKLENLKEFQLKALERVDRGLKDRLDKLDKSNVSKFSMLPPGIARKMAESPDFEGKLGKWNVRNVSKMDIGMAFIRREIASDKVMLAKNMLKDAKEKLEKAKQNLKKKKDDFKKTKTVEDAKSYLLNTIEMLTEKINAIKQMVQSSNYLSENKSVEVSVDLDASLAKLAEWKTKVEASTTKEDIKSLASQIRAWWKQLDHALKVHGWRLELEHFAGILKQAYQLDNKLNRWLTFADRNNVTITDKDTKVASFESSLTDSKNHFELAVEEFKKLRDIVKNKVNATDSDIAERKALVESVNAHIKEAKKSLKAARDVLVGLAKDVVKAIKDSMAKTEDGKLVQVTEGSILDPKQIVEGVETENGEVNIQVAEEESVEL